MLNYMKLGFRDSKNNTTDSILYNLVFFQNF